MAIDTKKTKELLLQALDSPNLAQPGVCRYVSRTSVIKRCVVSEVLSILGATDEELSGSISSWKENSNSLPIYKRDDLIEKFIKPNNLDSDLLLMAQNLFDSRSNSKSDISDYVERY